MGSFHQYRINSCFHIQNKSEQKALVLFQQKHLVLVLNQDLMDLLFSKDGQILRMKNKNVQHVQLSLFHVSQKLVLIAGNILLPTPCFHLPTFEQMNCLYFQHHLNTLHSLTHHLWLLYIHHSYLNNQYNHCFGIVR